MDICPHTGQPLKFPPQFRGDFGVSPDGVYYFRRARSLNYGPDYFLEDYQKQYGRSYEADAPALRALARRRLDLLAGIKPTGSLFEIGSALGFFLDEARLRGYTVSGLEISSYAAEYAGKTLNLDVDCASFLESHNDNKYDVAAAFYVIEHFADQRSVFERVSSLLKPGGVFLFALPSTNGPMFQYHREEWMRTHPEDHFADYSPRSLARTAERYGMKLIRVRPSSFHPSRALGLWRASGPLYRFLAERLAYGDTIEGILQKRA